MTGNKVLEYVIKAKDLTKTAIASAKGRLSKFVSSVKSGSISVFKNLMNIHAGFQMIAGIIKTVGRTFATVIQKSFDFETIQTQFEVLLHSAEKAKTRIQDLAVMAAHTPFTLTDLTTASKQLHVFTQGALGGTGSLKMIGDASAVTGASIQELSFWVGRLYSMIASGKPFGEAAMRLQELGIMTPEVRNKMEELQATGANGSEIWKVLTDRLLEFKGGMEKLSKTGNGLISTLKDNWSASLRRFGDAFSDVAKNGIKELSDALVRLVEDGTIERWANNVYTVMHKVYTVSKSIKDTFMDIWNWAGRVDQSIGDFMESLPFGNENGYSGRAVRQRKADAGYRRRMQMYAQQKKEREQKQRELQEQFDADEATARQNRENAEARKAEDEEKLAKEKAKKKAKFEEDMKEAQMQMMEKIVQDSLDEMEEAEIQKEKEINKKKLEDFEKAKKREAELENKYLKMKADNPNHLTPDARGENAQEFVNKFMKTPTAEDIKKQNDKDREKMKRRKAYLEKEAEKFKLGGKMSKKKQKELEALKAFFDPKPADKNRRNTLKLLGDQLNEARATRRVLEESLKVK